MTRDGSRPPHRAFAKSLKDDWDVQLVPKGKTGRKTGMGTLGYAISAQTKNADAAWDVLHYTFTEGMKVFMEIYLLGAADQEFL